MDTIYYTPVYNVSKAKVNVNFIVKIYSYIIILIIQYIMYILYTAVLCTENLRGNIKK